MKIWIGIIFLAVFNLSCAFFQPMSGRGNNFRVGVIVGPGGARALSAIGVLKVLQENNIPIDHIVGLGWGAWVAASYSKNKNVDEVKWSFYKLLKRGFFRKSFLNRPFQPRDISKMNAELKENFDSNQKTQIPFACPSVLKNGSYVWRTQNELTAAVKNCLVLPPFFKSSTAGSGTLFAVRKAQKYLNKKNINLVIFINPLAGGRVFGEKSKPPPALSLLWREALAYFRHIEEEEEGLVSAPVQLKNFSLKDFSKMDLIILEGQREGLFLVNKLRSLYPRLAF